MAKARPGPVSRLGDLWLCGAHRVLCGDATNREHVERLFDGRAPHLLVSDPPYGVGYDPAWRDRRDHARRDRRNPSRAGRRDPRRADPRAAGAPERRKCRDRRDPTRRDRRGAGAGRRIGTVLNDDRADWREAWALFPGDVAYVWHGALHSCAVAAGLAAAGFGLRSQIVWVKERLVFGRGHYHWQHEPCWYAVRRTRTGHWNGDRKQTTVWRISSRGQDMATRHPTQKPVECMRRPVLNNSAPGDPFYDPFLGSGTSVIAAETTGRSCLGIELYPAHVDTIVQRWASFTGEAPVEAGTALTLEALAEARHSEAHHG